MGDILSINEVIASITGDDVSSIDLALTGFIVNAISNIVGSNIAISEGQFEIANAAKYE